MSKEMSKLTDAQSLRARRLAPRIRSPSGVTSPLSSPSASDMRMPVAAIRPNNTRYWPGTGQRRLAARSATATSAATSLGV